MLDPNGIHDIRRRREGSAATAILDLWKRKVPGRSDTVLPLKCPAISPDFKLDQLRQDVSQ